MCLISSAIYQMTLKDSGPLKHKVMFVTGLSRSPDEVMFKVAMNALTVWECGSSLVEETHQCPTEMLFSACNPFRE